MNRSNAESGFCLGMIFVWGEINCVISKDSVISQSQVKIRYPLFMKRSNGKSPTNRGLSGHKNINSGLNKLSRLSTGLLEGIQNI
jgi:hypothetical protein